MKNNKHHLYLQVKNGNSNIDIVGLENDILVIAFGLRENVFDTTMINPYLIYKTLEDNNKNIYKNKKIIEKILKGDIIEYHFNYGLILDNPKNIKETPNIFFSYDVIGDKNAIPEDELQRIQNEYGYEGKGYKSIFGKEVYVNLSCFERLIFSHCEFKSKISFHIFENKDRKTEFHNGINFENCVFNDRIEFRNLVSGSPLPNSKYYKNERETNFKNCIFKKDVDFSNAKFFNDVYFNNSHFKDYADFHECEFEKTACFYGVTFDKNPNFSQAIFKESLNFVNVECKFEFEDIYDRINQQYQDFKENNKKSLDKFANDFRDSFRIIKNSLIKDNNLLDASSFHKYELYCKEIELKQNIDKQGKSAETENDVDVVKSNIKRFKNYIDCLLLAFYRKLCDHHTDFLKVCNNLVLLIALYALFCLGIIHLHGHKIKDKEDFSIFLDNFKFYFEIGLIIYIIGAIILILFMIKSCFNSKPISKSRRVEFTTTIKIIIKDLCHLIKNSILALVFSYMIYGVSIVFCWYFLNIDTYFWYSLIINTFFVSLYIGLVYANTSIFGRYILLILSYLWVFVVFVKYPTMIHPLIGKIAGEFDENFNYPSLMTLNILYTILMFLVLFSLQKTARKNSIVPH